MVQIVSRKNYLLAVAFATTIKEFSALKLKQEDGSVQPEIGRQNTNRIRQNTNRSTTEIVFQPQPHEIGRQRTNPNPGAADPPVVDVSTSDDSTSDDSTSDDDPTADVGALDDGKVSEEGALMCGLVINDVIETILNIVVQCGGFAVPVVFLVGIAVFLLLVLCRYQCIGKEKHEMSFCGTQKELDFSSCFCGLPDDGSKLFDVFHVFITGIMMPLMDNLVTNPFEQQEYKQIVLTISQLVFMMKHAYENYTLQDGKQNFCNQKTCGWQSGQLVLLAGLLGLLYTDAQESLLGVYNGYENNTDSKGFTFKGYLQTSQIVLASMAGVYGMWSYGLCSSNGSINDGWSKGTQVELKQIQSEGEKGEWIQGEITEVVTMENENGEQVPKEYKITLDDEAMNEFLDVDVEGHFNYLTHTVDQWSTDVRLQKPELGESYQTEQCFFFTQFMVPTIGAFADWKFQDAHQVQPCIQVAVWLLLSLVTVYVCRNYRNGCIGEASCSTAVNCCKKEPNLENKYTKPTYGSVAPTPEASATE